MTNQKIIDRALAELGILEAGESGNASDSAVALNELNQMMATWEVMDMSLGWFQQDELTATPPLPEWAMMGVISSLAIECAGVFRAPVTPAIVAKSEEGKNAIGVKLINLHLEQSSMDHLPQGRIGYYDIKNDS